MAYLKLLPFLLLLPKPSHGAQELVKLDPLYAADSVDELLGLCSELTENDFTRVPGRKFMQCPNGTVCIKFCDEDRFKKLREAQSRVTNMLATLQQLDRMLMQFAAFFIVLILGMYLVVKGQFNWRTLPWIGHEFEDDLTDGYRYSHYIWMDWVILDSNHPTYYVSMIPDAQELEYMTQLKEWRQPEGVEKRRGAVRTWTMKDINAMTTDPHERLETYFRMVEYQDLM